MNYLIFCLNMNMLLTFMMAPLPVAALCMAAPAPASLAGKVLEVDFRGAYSCVVIGDEDATDWQPAVATPLVVQFPAKGGNTFHIQLDMPLPGEEDLWPPNKVQYAPGGDVAVVTVQGRMRYLVLTLNFDTPYRGKAALSWGMDESGWLARDASFRIRPASTDAGRVELPVVEDDVRE